MWKVSPLSRSSRPKHRPCSTALSWVSLSVYIVVEMSRSVRACGVPPVWRSVSVSRFVVSRRSSSSLS